MLGLPTLGLAMATTVVTTYLPTVAKRFTGSTVIVGLVICSEGLAALTLPLVVGVWSDQLRTRIGGRLPFVLAGSVPLTIGLALLGWTNSLPATVLLVVVFFVGYFVAYEPYRALYPDLIRSEAAGRSQAIQALWRGGGTGVALVAGGLLLGVTQWLPFVAAAALYLATTILFLLLLVRHRAAPRQEQQAAVDLRTALRQLRELISPSTRRCGPTWSRTPCGSCR